MVTLDTGGWVTGHLPSSHPKQLLEGQWLTAEQASSSLIYPPKLVEKMLPLRRAHNHGVRWDSLWGDSHPAPWAMRRPLALAQPMAAPCAASGRDRSIRLTPAKVICLTAKLETHHKGKISKCTWNISPSLAADSFQSIPELPAVMTNSAAFLPCGVTKPTPSHHHPVTHHVWAGDQDAGQCQRLDSWCLSQGRSHWEQLCLLSLLPLSSSSPEPAALISNSSSPQFSELDYRNANVIQGTSPSHVLSQIQVSLLSLIAFSISILFLISIFLPA